MSMKYYGVQGYGLCPFNLHFKDKENLNNFDFLECLVAGTFLNYEDSCESKYILLYPCYPWQMQVQMQMQMPKTLDELREYFWDIFKDLITDTKEEFIKELNFIDDVYYG